MTDIQEPIDTPVEPTEPWVTGAPGPAQHVPGIDEVPETTYVEPTRNSDHKAIMIGAGIGLLVVAVVAAVALSQKSTDSPREAVVGSVATASSTSSTTSPSTTSTSVVTAATTVTTVAPTTVPAAAAAPPPAPTPRATADPALPPYVPVSLPAGVSGTLTSCSWQPTAGGQYQAAGTLTNGATTNHGWTVTMHWLQNSREIAQQSALVDLTASQSKPWTVTMSAPNPPADPFSCALSAS